MLFVGTKKQARDTVKEVAEAADMPYVNHRWLGGLLTNFQTINQRIRRLHDLERYETEGQLALLPTRERMAAQADLAKLRANLGGVKNMQRVPDAMFVIDLKTEEIAVKEAQRLRIPIIGLVDTNCDPDGIDFVIPGNDDAIRSCALITQAIGEVVSEGHAVFRAEEERARKEAEEKAKAEAEARAKREAEEQAKREAEEQRQERGRGQGRGRGRRRGRSRRSAAGSGAAQPRLHRPPRPTRHTGSGSASRGARADERRLPDAQPARHAASAGSPRAAAPAERRGRRRRRRARRPPPPSRCAADAARPATAEPTNAETSR